MPKTEEDNSLFNPKIWRHLVNFWTVVLYASIGADFFIKTWPDQILGPICAIYVALLAVYSADKEFQRWHDHNIGRHPGEVYVIIWTIIIISLFILEAYTRGEYKIPNDVFTTYIVVIGILAITKKSKSNYGRKRKLK